MYDRARNKLVVQGPPHSAGPYGNYLRGLAEEKIKHAPIKLSAPETTNSDSGTTRIDSLRSSAMPTSYRVAPRTRARGATIATAAIGRARILPSTSCRKLRTSDAASDVAPDATSDAVSAIRSASLRRARTRSPAALMRSLERRPSSVERSACATRGKSSFSACRRTRFASSAPVLPGGNWCVGGGSWIRRRKGVFEAFVEITLQRAFALSGPLDFHRLHCWGFL